jgi:hypothetical protein
MNQNCRKSNPASLLRYNVCIMWDNTSFLPGISQDPCYPLLKATVLNKLTSENQKLAGIEPRNILQLNLLTRRLDSRGGRSGSPASA